VAKIYHFCESTLWIWLTTGLFLAFSPDWWAERGQCPAQYCDYWRRYRRRVEVKVARIDWYRLFGLLYLWVSLSTMWLAKKLMIAHLSGHTLPRDHHPCPRALRNSGTSTPCPLPSLSSYSLSRLATCHTLYPRQSHGERRRKILVLERSSSEKA
jgi:hypothetical protein